MITALTILSVIASLYHSIYCAIWATGRILAYDHRGRLKGGDGVRSHPAIEVKREMWWLEVHIFLPITIIAQAIDLENAFSVVRLVMFVSAWLYFYFIDNDHDDRWKKRRKKVAAKVREAVSKLAVSPLPTPA